MSIKNISVVKCMKNKSRYVGLALFILMIGNGISWTGLGFQLSKLFSEPRLYAWIQICSILCSLVAPFLCVHLMRKMQVLAQLAYLSFFSCLCYCGIYFLWSVDLSDLFIMIIGILALFSLLSSAIEAILLEPAYAKSLEVCSPQEINYGREFAQLSAYGILGKLLGMSGGPILFERAPSFSLFLNAGTFFMASIFISLGLKDVKADHLKVQEDWIRLLRNWQIRTYIRQKYFIETVLVNASIFIVVLFFSTRLATLNASGVEFSLFWFGATACAFMSHWMMSRAPFINGVLHNMEKRYGYVICVPLLVGLWVENIFLIIASQWLVSWLNPITSNVSRGRFYSVFGKNDNTTPIYALRSLLSQLVILFFSAALLILYETRAQFLLSFLLCSFFIIRWYIGYLIENPTDRYVKN